MRRFALFVCFLLLVAAVFAQVGTTLTGTVADPTGAVVPNASLSVKNVDTGAIYAGGSTGTGNYVIALPAGNYELTVKVMGFKTTTVKGIHVETGATFKQDVKLELGTTTQEAVVTGQADLLKPESAEISHNVSIDRADNLPVLSIGTGSGLRNPLQVLNLLPGTEFATGVFSEIRVNGLPANSQAIKIDGQDASNGIWRAVTTMTQAGVDAIQEISIQTSNFAAEFGQAGGGIFNLTMKSGTNQYHGSAYDYYVNEALNAGTPGTNGGTSNSANCYAAYQNSAGGYTCYSGIHTKAKTRQVDYGFTIGGPIDIPKIYNGHDKTFFFFNFEQYRLATNTPNGLATVPTAAFQTGDFSAALLPQLTVGGVAAGDKLGCAAGSAASCGRPVFGNQIFDPYTTFLDPISGTTQRNPFVGNKIPLTAMCPGCSGVYVPGVSTPNTLYGDSVALKVQNMFPQPNVVAANGTTPLFNNYQIPIYDNFNHNTNPSIKLDHSISSTVKISGYWSRALQNASGANGFATDKYPWTTQTGTHNTSDTYRLNYDQTVTPTLLLHLGIGFIRSANPTQTVDYTPGCLSGITITASCPGIGLNGFYATKFPSFGGISNTFGIYGGFTSGIGAGVYSDQNLFDNKPTANASLTWVKNNHTFKLGGDLVIENEPMVGQNSANGIFNFSNIETANPFQNGVALVGGTTGLNYASFLLGQPDNLRVAPAAQTSLGNHGIGLYIQDTWKVTRKLTLDYGLRYDVQTLLREQYGRMQNASWSTPNATAGGRLGSVIYEGYGPGNSTGSRCQCQFNSVYPYAVGPRIGMAYQLDPKTVLRAGVGVSYGTTATNAYLSYSVPDFYQINSAGYGIGAFQSTGGLSTGNPYRANNPYGFAPLSFPNFDGGKFPLRTVNGLPPVSPFISIDRNAGRPPRIFSYSVGVQREITRNLVVEASYVGNRGAWFTAPDLQDMNANALNPATLLANSISATDVFLKASGQPGCSSPTAPVACLGLDPVNGNAFMSAANARTLLNSVIGSPTAIAAGPAYSTAAYPGMPISPTAGGSAVRQLFRPIPQYGSGIPGFLGPPLGDTWYDSLQAKVTKRYSHGLDVQGSFTYQKELALGTNSDTSYLTLQAPVVQDVYNRNANKQISVLSHPVSLVASGTYTTPRVKGDGTAIHLVSLMARDWQIGAVLRYESGTLLAAPNSSADAILTALGRDGGNNPIGTTGGGAIKQIPTGQPFFLNTLTNTPVDANCRCFDPTRALVLNPAAWQDVPANSLGAASPYYNNYRWQRQPSESMSLARNFRMGKEGKQNLQVRMEFNNVFNRLFWSAPSGVPATVTACTGITGACTAANGYGTAPLTAGFGFVSTINGAGARPRTGQLVARFTF